MYYQHTFYHIRVSRHQILYHYAWGVFWSPRSVTEFSPGKVLYQHVSIYLHAGMFVCLFVYLFVYLSEGCNPSSGLGVWGGRKSVCLSVCVCVCLSRGDYYFTNNNLYPLCIAVGLESIFSSSYVINMGISYIFERTVAHT